MEYLQTLTEHSTIPLFTAFILGILTAISPCPMATNITAIGYLSKDIENRHRVFRNGIYYTLGRLIVYTLLGFIIIPLLREGTSIYGIQKFISKYGEIFMGPALILIGVFMLFSSRINIPGLKFNNNGEKLKNKGGLGAFLLGIIFSLAFCPTSGVIYFGMLMPMSAYETGGYLLPIAFAIATGLPVIIVAWVLVYSISEISNFYKKVITIQKWLNIIISILFIVIGIYYIITLYI